MNESLPKVSIVLPTYNGAKYIRESIDSCLNQTYKNIELIIVDDASTDTTPRIIKDYNDSRIKYLRYDTNSGVSEVLNKGFFYASGQFLTWTSDDNYYTLNAIGCMVKVLESNKRIDFVYANFYKIDEKDNIIFERRVGSSRELSIENCIGACFLYRRKVYQEIGNYDPQALLAEDYDYWLRVREKFKLQKINKFLYYYRVHPDSLSSKYVTEGIEELIVKIRDKYISSSMKSYLYARKQFYKKNYSQAKKLLKQCFWLNICNRDAWRLLILLYLLPLITQVVRKTKWKILRIKQYK